MINKIIFVVLIIFSMLNNVCDAKSFRPVMKFKIAKAIKNGIIKGIIIGAIGNALSDKKEDKKNKQNEKKK
jgi:hypothetical protein